MTTAELPTLIAEGAATGGAARLRELLDELDALPAVPRSASCSQHRLDVCAEIASIVRARRAARTGALEA